MLKEQVKHAVNGPERDFVWRSHEISRIEGFSDAVFAFAVTLLVVSLEVPKTYNELAASMHGFLAFAISFTMLFQVWRAQNKFFRRYGLQDSTTHILSAILLFFVLFYVYPLKFLFNLLVLAFSGASLQVTLPDKTHEPIIEEGQVGSLMVVYGLGFAAVSLTLMLLYIHAFRQRHKLGLNKLEVHATLEEIMMNVCLLVVPLCSAAVAHWGSPAVAGWMYMSLAPLLTTVGSVMGKRRRLLREASSAEPF